ncbi:MAG: hypothetical protein ACREQO_11235 [Candidatus Binatia bacterium]
MGVAEHLREAMNTDPQIQPQTQTDNVPPAPPIIAQAAAQDSVFKGQISPQDRQLLLEFLRTSGVVSGRSYASAQVSVAASFSPTKITLDTNDFVNGITWDGTNHRFIAKSSGQYVVIGVIGFTNPLATVERDAVIYKNGSEFSRGMMEGTTELTALVMDILDLAVDDYIELYALQGNGSPLNTFSGSNLTYLSIAKL